MRSFISKSGKNNTDAKNQNDPLVQEEITLETIIDSLEKIDASERTEEEKKAAIKRFEDNVSIQSLEKMIARKLKEIDNDTDADALATKLLKIKIFKSKLIKHKLFNSVIATIDLSIQDIKNKLDEKIKLSFNPTWVNLSLDEKDNQLLAFEEVKIELHQAHDSKSIEKRIQKRIDERMRIEVIRSQAKTYANKRLTHKNNFESAIRIVKRQLNESIEEIAKELRENKIPLNLADSYKVAAMLKIYLLAEKALKLNQNPSSEMQERTIAKKALDNAVGESATHLSDNNIRYNSPKEYIDVIERIGFAATNRNPETIKAILSAIKKQNQDTATKFKYRFYELSKNYSSDDTNESKEAQEKREALIINPNLWATHDAGYTYLEMTDIAYDRFKNDTDENPKIARKGIESILKNMNSVYSDYQPEQQLINEIKQNILEIEKKNGNIKNIQKIMWLMNFSHFSFTHLISQTTSKDRAVIVAALSQKEDKEILETLQQQRLDHVHTQNDLDNILNELFSLPFGQAYASQKAVFAGVILAHKQAKHLDSKALTKLCSFLIPDNAKNIIQDNKEINSETKESIFTELKKPALNKNIAPAEQENKIYDKTIENLANLKKVLSTIRGLEYTKKNITRPTIVRGKVVSNAWVVSGSASELKKEDEERIFIIQDIADKIESLLRLKSESATQLIDKIVDPITVLVIFQSIAHDDNKITFIKHLCKRGYFKTISQEMMSEYIDYLTQSNTPEVCTQAYDLFSVSEYLTQIETVYNFSGKSSIYAQAILHNANMRKWLSSKKELHQALMTSYLKDFPYHAKTFTNWEEIDFTKAIGLAKSEQVWLLQWALLTNDKATEKMDSAKDPILESCFDELDRRLTDKQSFDKETINKQINAMSKTARIAFLNRLTNWEQGKNLVGDHIDAFIHDIKPSDIETNCIKSETLLFLAFNKNDKNRAAIIATICNKNASTTDEIATKNRKAAWSLLSRPDIEDKTTSEERHSLIKISVHGYTGNDGYTLNMNSALLSEFSNLRYGGDFQLNASNAAYKAMLSEPDFINIISQHEIPSSAERKSYKDIHNYLKFHNRQNFSSVDLLDIVNALETKEQKIPTQPEVKQKHKEQKPASVLVLDQLPTFLSNRVMQLPERNKSNEAEVKAIIESEVNAIKKLLLLYNNPPRGFKTIQEHPIICAIDNNKKLPVEVKNMVKSTIIGNDQQLFNQYINENKWRSYTAKDPWLKEFGKDLVKAASAMFLGAVIVRTVSKHFSYLNPLNWLQKIFQPQQESIWNKVLLLGTGALAGGGVSGAATLTTASIVIGGLVGIAGLAAVVLAGRAAADTYRHYAGIKENEKNDSEEISMIFEEYFKNIYGLTNLIKTTDRNKNAATESENKNEASLSPNKTIDTTTKALASMLIFCKERNHDVTENNNVDSNTRDQLLIIMNYHTRGSFSFFWRMFSRKLWNLEKSYSILIKQILETTLPGTGHREISQLLAGSSEEKVQKQTPVAAPISSAPTAAIGALPSPSNVKPSAPREPENVTSPRPKPNSPNG